MFISEIILEGFKTYASRTVLSGFDRSFNAITGKNGSGKSNILDAICFVLGISNLSQIRVSSLQEIVYKSGQAGITKASVTIVFDNTDKKQSPVGYEAEDQITVTRTVAIGGKNKYFINGTVAQLNRVENLFHSVQLNVNNPHFLIMQGRITKVLNMKPMETLNMIEEAAGTRMFETKKQQAIKTIEKKEKKLQEINAILNDEITPTLNKLKGERSKYLTWSQNNDECEKWERFCVAYNFVNKEEGAEKALEHMKQAEDEASTLEQQIKAYEKQIAAVDDEIKELKNRKSKEVEEQFQELEKQVNALSVELVKSNSVYQHKKDSVEQERKALQSLYQSIDEIKASITKGSQKSQSADSLEAQKNTVAQLTTHLANLQKQLHAVHAGIGTSGITGMTLTEALMEAKDQALKAVTELEKCALLTSNAQEEAKRIKQELQQESKHQGELDKQHKLLLQEIENLQKEEQKLGYNKEKHSQLKAEKDAIEGKIQKLKQEITELAPYYNRFSVEFDKKNVDASKIKGAVAQLFDLKDEKAALALEVTAGAKLGFVVCEDEQVAKQLIEKGRISQRVTTVPLTKIKYQEIPAQSAKIAEEIGDATPAISWIECDKSVEPAMKFTFGNSLICNDLDKAEQVAFHKSVMKKTVTLAGDSFDPQGTLTGGSRPGNNGTILKKLSLYKLKQKELGKLQERLTNVIIPELEKMEKQYSLAQKVSQQRQLKEYSLEHLQTRMQGSKHAQLQQKLKDFESQIEQAAKDTQTYTKMKQEAEQRVREVEQEMKSFEKEGANKEQQIKRIEAEIVKTRAQLQEEKQILQQKGHEAAKNKLQVEELQKELEELESKASDAKKSLATLEKELKTQEKEVQAHKNQYEAQKQALDDKKASIQQSDKEISELVQRKEKLRKKQTDSSLEMKKVEHRLTRLKKEQKDAQSYVHNIVKEHPWITQERAFFGQRNSTFDFSKYKYADVQEKLQKLKSEQDKLAKSINKKVMGMFENAEQQYNSLIEKKQTVENDRKKIEQTIKELDEKKKELIQKTWETVNGSFGSIFSTLLPGAFCKLEPQEGKSVLEGLEVKVAFSNMWKDSLTELSGGQRSLLALSLILSLLKYKPAPMYILDEIDAALDPSHTQNIGKMLKHHFQNSQFIVVSLKEGMFQNANVLYEVKFNGQSNVTKTTKPSSVVRDFEESEKENQVNAAPSSKQSTTTTTTQSRKRKRGEV